MPSGPRRIAFWGNFGTRNLGNECTLSAAVQATRARLPAAELLCICTGPDDVRERHGLAAFPILDASRRAAPGGGRVGRLAAELRAWSEAFRRMRGVDTLVMTGTGMLSDEGESVLGFTYDVFRWVLAARLRGARVAFASVGVEQLGRPLTRALVRAALRLAQVRSYRDAQSRQRLVDAGVDAASDVVAPDLAFALPEHTLPRGRPAEVAGTVAVGVYPVRHRGLRGGEDARLYHDYLERVRALVRGLEARGRRVLLVVGDNAWDEAVLSDLLAGDAAALSAHPAARSFQEVLAQLAGAELVVASRFHNVLLALLLGRPVVSLSYEAKNDALMADFGLSGLCQPVESFDVQWALDRVEQLGRERDARSAQILAQVTRKRLEVEAQLGRILGAPAPGLPRSDEAVAGDLAGRAR